MEMLIGGTWQPAASGRTEDVTSPFDGTVTGTVPVAGPDDVRAAVNRAESGCISVQRVITHPAVVAGVDPRSAVAEMTDVKTVILHGRPW